MMKLNSITNRIKSTPKKLIALIAVLLVLAVPAFVLAGWGPDRPTFDYNVPCDNGQNANSRCGSLTGPVFNSFIHTPSYGDERNFTTIADVVPGQSPTEGDFKETSNAQPGKEYWVRTLVHNDANQSTNDAAHNFIGVAHNTRVRLQIPTEAGNGVEVMTHVTADNAAPNHVWDTASLANQTQKFDVSYVPGSAAIYNGVHQGGMALSDEIVSANGTKIGFENMNGDVPGCFDFSAYVYVKVKVAAPQVRLEKQVRLKGQGPDDWKESIKAKKGQRVQYVLDFLNNGNGTAHDLVIRDKLPSNVQLVPGSVEWVDTNRPDGTPIPDASVFSDNGLLVGNYGVHGGGFIYFDAIVKNDVKECEAKNVAFIRGSDTPEQEDEATVVIEDCVPPQPVVKCDLMTATSIGDNKYRFDTTYTATNGAKLKTATYTFGDNSAPLVTDKTTVEHTYAKPGTYVSKVTLTFQVGDQTKEVTSPECMKTITINPPTVVVKCDQLTAESLGDRQFRFTVRHSSQNATYKSATFNFGDNSAPVTGSATTVNHTYAQDGDYQVRASVTFTVNGQDQTVTSDACAMTVRAQTPKNNCPIPGKEHLPMNSPECKNVPVTTVLPNTGAGDILGIFAATTVAGVIAYHLRLLASRRFGA
jgi:uncharacterized repeat protein (TIGR01451 family)